MSEYDSQKWNLFRYPLVWFLIAAAFAQAVILFNSPTVHAASSPSSVAPIEAPRSEGALPVPVKVELPAPQELKQTIVTQAQPAPKVTPPVRAVSSPIETVIQFALAQRGKPYRWAGAGPNSYDCSGLVMVAFSKIGIKLPHFTGALISYGKPVSRGALQRGDIVFPASRHVAIYIGDNQMVEAPQPGDVIKVSKVYSFYAARRLV